MIFLPIWPPPLFDCSRPPWFHTRDLKLILDLHFLGLSNPPAWFSRTCSPTWSTLCPTSLSVVQSLPPWPWPTRGTAPSVSRSSTGTLRRDTRSEEGRSGKQQKIRGTGPHDIQMRFQHSRFASVVLDGVLRPPGLARHTWLCSRYDTLWFWRQRMRQVEGPWRAPCLLKKPFKDPRLRWGSYREEWNKVVSKTICPQSMHFFT